MSGYIGTQPVPQATQTRDSFTATSGQTSFATGGYTPNFLDVYLNGVKLASADYTATNGSDVVLASGAATGDILEVVAYTAFDTANVTGATNFTVTGAFTSQGIDDNGNATAITIDSSENVMFGGHTSTHSPVENGGSGVSLLSNGQILAGGQYPSYFNREDSDGDIAVFRKDGSAVGSIGVESGDLKIGHNTAALDFLSSESRIRPWNMSTNLPNDNAVSLGRSNTRFKDLYLSGGIYLGGTGSANKLEDYEEGTWTPQLSSDVAITSYTILNGYYTKVGRLVTVSATVQAASLGSWSGATIALYGLPFTVSNDSNNEAVGTLAMRGTTGDKDGLYIRFIQNGTYMRLEHRSGYPSHDPNMPANTIDTGTKIYVTGSYFVA